ncbi:MAG: helix-turn-helix domain-containing protein [Spirochaetales bacterium]|nr:helix-turn-helix domain-containing protein [Spirochaetales bacterium]
MRYESQLKKLILISSSVFVLAAIVLSSLGLYLSQNSEYEADILRDAEAQRRYLELKVQIMEDSLRLLRNSNIADSLGSSDNLEDFYHSLLNLKMFSHKVDSPYPELAMETNIVILDSVKYLRDFAGYDGPKVVRSITGFTGDTLQQLVNEIRHNNSTVISFERNSQTYWLIAKTYHYSELAVSFLIVVPKNYFTAHLRGNSEFKMFVKNQLLQQQSYGKSLHRVLGAYWRFLPSKNRYTTFSSFAEEMEMSFEFIYEAYSCRIPYYIVFTLLIMVVAFYLTLRLGRRLTTAFYSPINQIVQEFGVGEGGQDEFSLIKENIRLIKGINAQLQEKSELNSHIISEKRWFDCLRGLNISQMKAEFPRYAGKGMAVAYLEMDARDAQGRGEELYLLKKELRVFAHSHIGLQYVDVEHNSAVLIVIQRDETQTMSILESLVAQFETHIRIRIALSSSGKGFASLSGLYNQALKTMEYKNLFADRLVLTNEDVKGVDNQGIFYPIVLENKLMNEVLDGNPTALDTYASVIRHNRSLGSMTPPDQKKLIISLIGTINRVQQELKMDGDSVSPLVSLLLDNDERMLQGDVFRTIEEILEELIRYVNTTSGGDEHDIRERMVRFVEEGYTDNIMLSELADSLDITPQYCSILFKRLIGDNFKNHLTHIRIEKAKEQLRADPEYKISRLSREVGYNSPNTFIRVFNKLVGMSPKSFAKSFIPSQE